MPSFALGSRTFPTKRAAKAFISSFLHSYPQSSSIEPKHLAWVLPLFARHPNARQKLKGIASVSVERRGNHPSFILWFFDGHCEPISYITCLFSVSHTHRLYCALRNAIKESTHAHVTRALTQYVMLCDECDAPLSDVSTTKIEYDASQRFCNLVTNFFRLKRIDESHVFIESVLANEFDDEHHTLVDTVLEEEWVHFHAKMASFRMVCASCVQPDTLIG